MSEYQYYEFLTIDRPLTEQEQAYIRSLSRRVHLTPTQAVFTYSYSDLPADALTLLEAHFDAMLYLANWGSKQLAFRFPHAVLDRERILRYCGFEEISLTATQQHAILNLRFDEEEGMGWIEGEGLLTSLASLRHDILHGDLRVLYLAWLKAVHSTPNWYVDLDDLDEADADYDGEDGDAARNDDLLEPPVPAGLGQLSGPLQTFADLFEIDADLIAAAAAASPPLEVADDRIEEWVTMLPEAERNAFLVRVARGEPHAGVQLRHRLREVGGRTGDREQPSIPRRTFAELLAAAEQRQQRRKEQERQEAERARLQRLETLAQREPEAWIQVRELIERKQAKAYDQATALLAELRELADHRGQREPFDTRLNAIQAEYQNRSALLARLRKASLI